ncbi:siderophore-interacting protein [Microlunatus parietis]|uniref:NADPH-dependent ferric siderophore reductase n=1 Tax=Microlunatus parietis TaxID=682979 RepID=A0A7Y9IEN4_9ACTN|nr:siderophore-interacting protein [Microlunatus parietis]NYE75410.1 NADPH-dependent ferric siderophore reductase [Microlunatus parietis]
MSSIRQAVRELSNRGDVFTCPVRIDSVTTISPGLLRIRVTGPGLTDYRDPRPADAFKIAIPVDGGPIDFPGRRSDRLPVWNDGPRPLLRAFTVRGVAEDRSWLDFDAWWHGDAYTAGWLRRAPDGTEIGISGMRREFVPALGVDRHVLVGDACALPAVAAIVESLPDGTAVTAVLGVADEADRAVLPERSRLDVHWTSNSSPYGSDTELAAAVRHALPEPTGERLQVWIGAEAGVVREVRRYVLDHDLVARDDLHASAYWKAGEDSTVRDAALLTEYQRLVADGASATDPDTRELAELGAS